MARLKGLSPARMRNAWLLWQSHRRAQRAPSCQGPLMPPGAMPMSLSIEPTTSCNLRCPECPSGLRSFTRKTGLAKVQDASAWIHGMAESLVYCNLYFQGEPLLHPQLEGLIDTCRGHGIYASTSTNAHHLTAKRAQSLVEAGLNRLIVSIDGATQESYASYRIGGQLERVLEGTGHVLEASRSAQRGTHVVWQFLVVKPNEHDIPEIQRMAREMGVHELVLKTAQLDDPRDGHPLLASHREHRRYDRDEASGKWVLRNPLKDECWRMWQGAVATWDGNVVPCCFDKDASHVMGNLNRESMKAIWHASAYDAFRRQVTSNRQGIDMCTNCSEGSHVYA